MYPIIKKIYSISNVELPPFEDVLISKERNGDLQVTFNQKLHTKYSAMEINCVNENTQQERRFPVINGLDGNTSVLLSIQH